MVFSAQIFVLRAMTDARDFRITPAELLSQVVADWLDKEVQAGYTYTYIWMTNQLGHFTLGFLPTLLVAWIIESAWHWFGNSQPVPLRYLLVFPAALAVIWALKEVRDVVVAEKDAKKGTFPVDSSDLWKDAGTAVFFFWSGIIPATLGLFNPLYAVISFFILLPIAVVVPAWYWLTRKLCFQRGHMPYLARLADFTSRFQSGGAYLGPKDILQFVADAAATERQGPSHLLIFGAIGTGRSTLAVAMATEHSFAVRPVRYTTWTKFLEVAHSDTNPTKDGDTTVWPWKSVDILVLDDVVDCSPETFQVRLQEKRAELEAMNSDTRQNLKSRCVVWAMNALDNDTSAAEQWIALLSQTFSMQPSEFGYVELMGFAGKPRLPVSSLSGH